MHAARIYLNICDSGKYGSKALGWGILSRNPVAGRYIPSSFMDKPFAGVIDKTGAKRVSNGAPRHSVDLQVLYAGLCILSSMDACGEMGGIELGIVQNNYGMRVHAYSSGCFAEGCFIVFIYAYIYDIGGWGNSMCNGYGCGNGHGVLALGASQRFVFVTAFAWASVCEVCNLQSMQKLFFQSGGVNIGDAITVGKFNRVAVLDQSENGPVKACNINWVPALLILLASDVRWQVGDKFINVKARHLGKDIAGAINPIKLPDGTLKKNFINLEIANFCVSEKGDYRDIVDSVSTNANVTKDNDDDVPNLH